MKKVKSFLGLVLITTVLLAVTHTAWAQNAHNGKSHNPLTLERQTTSAQKHSAGAAPIPKKAATQVRRTTSVPLQRLCKSNPAARPATAAKNVSNRQRRHN